MRAHYGPCPGSPSLSSMSWPCPEAGADWPESFPDLVTDPPVEKWRHAWADWCQTRNVPEAVTAAAHLERRDQRLLVALARPLLERLRPLAGPVFKGDVWILAGEGRLRSAARLEVLPIGG